MVRPAYGTAAPRCGVRVSYTRPMWRLPRAVLAALLVLMGLGALGLKGWLTFDGPYLEALPAHPFCDEAEAALAADRVGEALELAEAGACGSTLERAQARWDSLTAVAARCWEGIWTGRGEGDAGVGCAVASDLVVFGDVRDLTRQGIGWSRGEETDAVLIALSAAGVVLTLAPTVGAGTSLVKVARRTGALTRGLADSVVTLARQRAFRPLVGLLGDAGRISRKLGPARGTRVLAYADTPAELATVARFVERAPHPLLALRWGGKSATRIGDDALYQLALTRGPRGLALAAERGGAALLSRKPLVLFAAKSLYKHPDQVAAWALALAKWLLRWATWPLVLVVSGVLVLAGVALFPRRRRRRWRGAAPAATAGPPAR
jgi:hypothetical protein